MGKIIKSDRFEDIPPYDKEYWWSKTPQERLDAALNLIQYAKMVYHANPKNTLLDNGSRILKSDKPIKRKYLFENLADSQTGTEPI